jgi:HPt (histidine-containing phosphotransfer) domain-containing protein
MAADGVLDPDVVAGLRAAQEEFENPAFISDLVGLFLARTPEKLDRVRKALAAGDAATVGEVAHSLRSNCGMLGAMEMAAACDRLEVAAALPDLPSAAAAFADVESRLPAVLAALAEL